MDSGRLIYLIFLCHNFHGAAIDTGSIHFGKLFKTQRASDMSDSVKQERSSKCSAIHWICEPIEFPKRALTA